MGLNTCRRRNCVYTGENCEAGRGGVAPNRCKMGHSELQKIDQTVKIVQKFVEPLLESSTSW